MNESDSFCSYSSSCIKKLGIPFVHTSATSADDNNYKPVKKQ